MTSPAEDVLAVVAEFGADLQAAAKNAIDAVRETAATSQESYALEPLPPGTFIDRAPTSRPSLAALRIAVRGVLSRHGDEEPSVDLVGDLVTLLDNFSAAPVAVPALDRLTLGLGAVVRANFFKGRHVFVHAEPGGEFSQWWSLHPDWVDGKDLTDIEVLHPGITVRP